MGSSVAPRLAVVSLHAHRPMAPRGERTRRLVECFEARGWQVSVVAPPPTVSTSGSAGRGQSNPARRLAARTLSWGLLDKWEPWSAQTLRRWQPRVDAALRIAFPFSPVAYASRRLRPLGIPYVVDAGDPWILTNPSPYSHGLASWRSRRSEQYLWEGASGAVLTTPQQARRLNARFSELPVLVRPNGYDPPATAPAPSPRPADGRLRIAHFGMLSSERLDLRPLLAGLAAAGVWEGVVFDQFGDDFVGLMGQLPPGVSGTRRDSAPWQRVVEAARAYDLALVVGNVNPGQLPSKAIQYLTLPIPRIAVTLGGDEDALYSYVNNRPGWLAVSPDVAAPARLVGDFLARGWSAADLAPPAPEAWPAVANEVVDFVDRVVS